MIDLQFIKQKVRVAIVQGDFRSSPIGITCYTNAKLQIYETVLTAIAENCQLPDLLAKEVLKLKGL